jgi:hypothetical protein
VVNIMTAPDAAAQAAEAVGASSGEGTILPSAALPSGALPSGALPSAATTRQHRAESVTFPRPRPRAAWDVAGLTGQHGPQRIAADPAMTGLGDLGNQSMLAGRRNPYVQCSPSKQFPYTTRFAAAGGDAKGPHPARDPV